MPLNLDESSSEAGLPWTQNSSVSSEPLLELWLRLIASRVSRAALNLLQKVE